MNTINYRRLIKKIKIAGKTKEEGFPVIKGCYNFYSGAGIPLENILSFLYKKGYIIDWIDFYTDAFKNNRSLESINSQVFEACVDVIGISYAKVVKNKIEELTKKRN